MDVIARLLNKACLTVRKTEIAGSSGWGLAVGCFIMLVSCFPLQAEMPGQFILPEQPEEGLEFEEIDVVDISETQARVVVELNHPAYVRLEYGPGKLMGRESTMMRATASHEFLITNLVEGTYHGFRLQAWVDPQEGISTDILSFKTEGTAPPNFQAVTIKERTAEGAMIEWRTNIPVTAKFYSGHDTEFGYDSQHPVYSRVHGVDLVGFYPDTTVYYKIEIEDERGRTNQTSVRSFETRENNVAWRQPVEGSFDQPPYGVSEERIDTGERFVERITNGMTNYTDGTATSGDPDLETQWFLIDLQQPYPMEKAVFLWREHAYPQFYHLLTSSDGEEWIEQAIGLDAGAGEQLLSDGGMPSYKQVVKPDYPEELVQFIRVEIPRGAPYFQYFPQYNFVQLIDFKFFPAEQPEPVPGVDKQQLDER